MNESIQYLKIKGKEWIGRQTLNSGRQKEQSQPPRVLLERIGKKSLAETRRWKGYKKNQRSKKSTTAPGRK